MTNAPVRPLILHLGIPTVLSMLVTALYNTASTYYVSYLGTSAVGAMGVVFALQTIIQAIGIMIGQGCAGQTSRLLGARSFREASEIASTGLFSVLALSSVLAVAGTFAIEPLLLAMGATTTILPWAKAYAEVILLAAPFMAAAFTLNNLLRSEGLALVGMIGLGIGGVLNIAVSPIFIFTFGWGISGAAWATGLCQTLSFAILLSHYLRGKGTIRLRVRAVSKRPAVYLSILKTGMPSLARNAFGAVAASILNLMAGQFGDAAVAAMSMVGRVIMTINAALIGIGQGYQPVLGYNWGAKRFERSKDALDATLSMATALMSGLGVLCWAFAPDIINFFETNDPVVFEIGTAALRYQAVICPLIPVNVIGNMSYQVIGRAGIGTLLASTRQGIFFLPTILFLPGFIGITGVEMAQPLSELCSFFVCGYFVLAFRKELIKLMGDTGAQKRKF